MHSLFNHKSSYVRGIRQPSSWSVAQKRIAGELINITRHVRGSNYAVSNNHVLVQILTGLHTDPELPVLDFYRRVKSKALSLSRAYGLVSAQHNNKVHTDGDFYGRGSDEIYVYMDEDVDLVNVDKDWAKLRPVRILKHSNNSLSLGPIDGNGGNEGFAIIGIDIVKLALMYRGWYLDNLSKGNRMSLIGSSTQQFVYKYPLTSALASHVDVSLMNMFIALHRGIKLDRADSRWPIYIRDWTHNAERYLLERLSYLNSRELPLDQMLEQITLVDKDSLQKVIALPDTLVTRQNQWVFTLMRMDITSTLVQIDYSNGNAKNRKESFTIRRGIRELMNSRLLDVGLTGQEAGRTLQFILDEIYSYLSDTIDI